MITSHTISAMDLQSKINKVSEKLCPPHYMYNMHYIKLYHKPISIMVQIHHGTEFVFSDT